MEERNPAQTMRIAQNVRLEKNTTAPAPRCWTGLTRTMPEEEQSQFSRTGFPDKEELRGLKTKASKKRVSQVRQTLDPLCQSSLLPGAKDLSVVVAKARGKGEKAKSSL